MNEPKLHVTTPKKIYDLTPASGWEEDYPLKATVVNGVVYLSGYARAGSGATKTLLTLPAEITPTHTPIFVGCNSGASEPTNIQINPDGEIRVFDSKWALTYIKTVTLDGCSWVLPTE